MIIYVLTNIKNYNKYVGLTTKSIFDRVKGHNCKRNNSVIANAIRKHGMDSFNITVLDCTAKSLEELKKLEKHYIAKLKPEYNMTSGGDGWIPSSYIKSKISKALKGRKYLNRKPMSEEQKEKLRQANLGKKSSEETKRKISKKLKGTKKPFTEEHKAALKEGWRKRRERLDNEKSIHSN